jgi:hypothetical protein
MPFPALRHVELWVDLPKEFRNFVEEVDLSKNEKIVAGFQNKA